MVTFDIPNTAILDEQTQKIVAIGLLMPPEQITLLCEDEWPRRRKLDAGPLLHLEAKPIHPAFLDDILQPRVFSIGAIAKIAMNRDHRLSHALQMLWGQKADHISDTRKCVRVAVRHSHTAARQQIVTGQLAVFRNDDKTEVIGKNINVIQRWKGKGRLEFARQIIPAVKRINKIGVGLSGQIQFLAIEPDSVIGWRSWRQGIGKFPRLLEHLLHQRTGRWRRRRHHIALHVAAGRDGGH